MRFQYIPYAWLLIASAAITLGLAVHGWRQRQAAGMAAFAFLMSAATVWSVANALEMAGTDLPTKLFWANLQYVCHGVVTIAWLALVMWYTGRQDRLTGRLIAGLSVEPLITVVLAWTNGWHGLIRRSVSLDAAGPFPVIAKTYGLWFPIHAVYSYLLLLIALYMLVEMLLRAQAIYRQQTRVLTIGSLIPLAASLAYTVGLSPFPRHDVTPVTMGIAGLAAAWGLFQYRLFDLVPIAHPSILDGIDDGILVLDAQERVIEINRAAREILGAHGAPAPASPIGQPVATVFNAWPALVGRDHDAPAGTSEITLGEGEAQRSYEVRISPLAGGRDRRAVRLFILRDITRRTRAEQTLRTRNRDLTLLNSAIQTLTSSLDLDRVLADIMDQVRDLLYAEVASVWLIDPATGELVCRQSAGRRKEIAPGSRLPMSEGLVEWTARTGRSAIVPDTRNEARHFPGGDRQTSLDLRSILSAPLRAQDKVIGVLEVADSRPNRFNPADLNVVEPLVGAAATAIMNARLYETAQQEIAERQRAQEALRQQTIELETRNTELDAFAHTVAHDLKNPLAVVMGYAELLDLYQASYTPEDRKVMATEIVRATHKMYSIIQELLLLSEVRKAEVALVPLNMGAIVDEARQRLAQMQAFPGEIRAPSEWPTAMGHAPWVEQVWVNYLSNAIKYGGSESEPPRIELGAETQADGMIRFWVHDNGPGIAPEDQARLFTPFTRLDQARATGHGLGLSIVRRIAEKLGGQASVDSQVGQGSTFSFTLAAHVPQPNKQEIASSTRVDHVQNHNVS